MALGELGALLANCAGSSFLSFLVGYKLSEKRYISHYFRFAVLFLLGIEHMYPVLASYFPGSFTFIPHELLFWIFVVLRRLAHAPFLQTPCLSGFLRALTSSVRGMVDSSVVRCFGLSVIAVYPGRR